MTKPNRKTIPDIRAHKNRAAPLVCLTAYTTQMARLLDPHCDLFIIGDSVGMALYGMENTLGVDLEMMIRHGQAVMRAAPRACTVIDMPFGSYEESKEQALRNAVRLLKETGCDAVKLEGGADMAGTIDYLVKRNVPVMGHIGLLPQSVVKEGGYKVKGRTAAQEEDLIKDAKEVEEAGAFAIVIEGTVADVAESITKMLSIPTIGIGASPACDGQVLVTEDMLGLFENVPKFVRKYANLEAAITEAVQNYATDVRARRFPAEDHLYTRPKAVPSASKKAS